MQLKEFKIYREDFKGKKVIWQIYYKDKQGRLQGKYKWFYLDGNYSTIEHYKNGSLHGMERLWDYDGFLNYITFNKNNPQFGECLNYVGLKPF